MKKAVIAFKTTKINKGIGGVYEYNNLQLANQTMRTK